MEKPRANRDRRPTARSRRGRFVAVAAATVAALGGMYLAWHRADPAPRPDDGDEASAPVAPRPAPARALGAAPRDPGPPPADPAEAAEPVVEAAYVDKREVCRGELNFVNVDAYTRNGTDQFLSVTVIDPGNGQVMRGSRVAFRMDRPSSEGIQIVVHTIDGEKAVTLPPVTVKDCDEPLRVDVRTQRTFDAPDRMMFAADVSQPAAAQASGAGPFAPFAYEWDFGDGQTAVTSTATVEHSYEGREQTAKQSSFVVAVKVKDRGGRAAMGAQTVTFSNYGFVALELRNKIEIQIGARVSETGRAMEALWLYHGHKQPVRLTQVVMREVQGRGADGREREVARAEYTPQALGFSEIPPRESRTVLALAQLAPTRPGTIRYFDVLGRSADGKPASATFVLAPFSTPDEGNTNNNQHHDQEQEEEGQSHENISL